MHQCGKVRAVHCTICLFSKNITRQSSAIVQLMCANVFHNIAHVNHHVVQKLLPSRHSQRHFLTIASEDGQKLFI